MKAILVVDVEEYGNYYVDVYRKDDGNRFDDRFEGRYYLKPMPQKKEIVRVFDCGIDGETKPGVVIDHEAVGWNACLEEITK